MKRKAYFFCLEIALRDKDDPNIYAYENISHIPTIKLCEIFDIDLVKDPYILEGYFLTETRYNNHRNYINEKFGAINLGVFEYCLRQYISDDFSEVRNLYKEDLWE